LSRRRREIRGCTILKYCLDAEQFSNLQKEIPKLRSENLTYLWIKRSHKKTLRVFIQSPRRVNLHLVFVERRKSKMICTRRELKHCIYREIQTLFSSQIQWLNDHWSLQSSYTTQEWLKGNDNLGKAEVACWKKYSLMRFSKSDYDLK